jgi:hypothetical protein
MPDLEAHPASFVATGIDRAQVAAEFRGTPPRAPPPSAREREEALRMTAEHIQGDEPLIAMPALTARRAAASGGSRHTLPAARLLPGNSGHFRQVGDEDSVFPIRHFYQRWGATIAIERRPSTAARLHAAERALADPDDDVRERAVQEAADIVQAAYHEVAGG